MTLEETIKDTAEKYYPVKGIREEDLIYSHNYELNQIAIRIIQEAIRVIQIAIKIGNEYKNINKVK